MGISIGVEILDTDEQFGYCYKCKAIYSVDMVGQTRCCEDYSIGMGWISVEFSESDIGMTYSNFSRVMRVAGLTDLFDVDGGVCDPSEILDRLQRIDGINAIIKRDYAAIPDDEWRENMDALYLQHRLAGLHNLAVLAMRMGRKITAG